MTTGPSLGTFFTKLFLEVLHVLFYADKRIFYGCHLVILAAECWSRDRDDKLIKCKLPGDHVIMTSGPVTSVPEGAGAVMSDVLT